MRHRKPREIRPSTYNPIPRMMNLRLTLLLWSVLITHTYGQVSEKKNSNATTGAVSDVQLIDQLPEGSIYEKIWQPFLARWSDTQYVVAYGLQLKGKGDMGDIVCSISPDQGKTWSTPIMIFDHRQPNGTQQFAYNNAVLFKPNNSDVLWCFAMRAPQHYRDSEDSGLVAAYSSVSTDSGRTWSVAQPEPDLYNSVAKGFYGKDSLGRHIYQ